VIVSAIFDKEWEEVGPKEHPYKEDYREEAISMVERTLDYSSASRARMLSPKWRVKLRNGDVIVRPDYAEIVTNNSDTQLLIQEMCFGPPPSKPPYEHYHALYDAAATDAHPGVRVRIQSVYMSNGDVVDVTVTQSSRKASLSRYEMVIQGISRGEFEARPDDRRCPYCPCFFICPAAENMEDYTNVR
jgi:DNA helicase-2/ATP-dependent DNA helicase PcrA